MTKIYSPEKDSYLLAKVLEIEIPKLISKNSDLKFLEIGSGSGIQLTTAQNAGIKKANIFACDINSEAVKHCVKLGFNTIKSNLFSAIQNKFDLIVWNPPYLPEDLREPKDSQVATTGGRLGSEIINKFLVEAKKHLAVDGRIFLLVSSLTKGINFSGYRKELLKKEKVFFEELMVLDLNPTAV